MQSDQDEKVRRFFSSFSSDWDALYGGRRNLFWRLFDQALRRDIYVRYEMTFEKLGADLAGKTILDVGCGSGIYSVEAARRGARRVLGIDVSDAMIELAVARRNNSGCVEACEFIRSLFPVECPIQALDAQFDYGIAMGVMDYVSDPDEFLRALRPRIRTFALLSFPGNHWLRAPLRRFRYRLLGRCEIYTYSEHEIREACTRAGFARVDIQALEHSGICYFVTAYS